MANKSCNIEFIKRCGSVKCPLVNFLKYNGVG